jgi:hypothetical protein
MNTTDKHNEKIANLTFSSVYPMYVKKVETKGRTKEELHQVIEWLTGFNNKKLQELIKEKVSFETFFERASLDPNAKLITINLRILGGRNRKSADAAGQVFG